jgi:choline dehydrogenase-like flavoprotein
MGGSGVRFTETMRGFASTSEVDDFQVGFEKGKADGSPLEFTVTVTADDIDRLVDDPAHEAELEGTVTAPALSAEPLVVEGGRFNLLVRDAEHAGARQMLYSMPLVAEDGRRFHLEGFKQIHDEHGLDLWGDTTTLYVTVHDGLASGPVAAKGIATIHAGDFRKQLGTMEAINADSRLDELKTLAKFGRLFAGSLNESFGKVFARPSRFNPDAPPREHRDLRCGEPEVHAFTTDDGVELRLTRFNGGPKGPVILSPGFGTSAAAYTLDTTDTTFPEYLFEHGYDVWVLDYRASPALASGSTQFTLDDIAKYDYPAAVRTVREISGAASVQIMAHCIGSATMLMSLALGLEDVRHAVASQVTLHPRAGTLNELRSGIYAGNIIQALGVDTLTTDRDDDMSWGERLYERALQLYPSGEEACDLPFCRRVMFMYGEVYDHDQLNDATHEHLHEVFGVANMTTFKQITLALREGHIVAADGSEVYLPATDNMKLPITFLHGEHNRLFKPEGSQLTYDYLREKNDSDLYNRVVIPGYAHMDLFIGKDAARDVYPVITAELDRFN